MRCEFVYDAAAIFAEGELRMLHPTRNTQPFIFVVYKYIFFLSEKYIQTQKDYFPVQDMATVEWDVMESLQ